MKGLLKNELLLLVFVLLLCSVVIGAPIAVSHGEISVGVNTNTTSVPVVSGGSGTSHSDPCTNVVLVTTVDNECKFYNQCEIPSDGVVVDSCPLQPVPIRNDSYITEPRQHTEEVDEVVAPTIEQPASVVQEPTTVESVSDNASLQATIDRTNSFFWLQLLIASVLVVVALFVCIFYYNKKRNEKREELEKNNAPDLQRLNDELEQKDW